MSGVFGNPWLYNPSDDFFSHKINQSLRFDDGRNTYLNKTFSTTQTNVYKITASFWFKISAVSTTRLTFLHARNGGGGEIKLNSHKIYANLFDTGYDGFFNNRLIRDPSAWYHLVYQGDSTLSTAADRNKVYLNGVQLDNNASSYTQQDTATYFLRNGLTSNIGRNVDSSSYDMNGYMAELHVIDGSIVAHTEFGETSEGVWIGKKYTGSYGNNGFYMTFQGTGIATTADGTTAQLNIGDDQSGNGRNFAVNALESRDVVPDSPTNVFATANPLAINTSSPWTTSEGNLKILSSSNNKNIRGNFLMQSGKWYWETRRHNANNSNAQLSDGLGISLASGNPRKQPIPKRN